ncbi:zf-HC2 domain-containing protein [Draconibacterium sp.]|nr:zf-HC2 domain-containing protein [Draconibacterium sp.]
MNCKKAHNKLIFFLEKELPISDMKQVQEHINSCSDCALFVEEMKKTLSILAAEKSPEVNPFFYTRLKAKLENQETERESAVGRPVLARVLQPVAFSIILLLGIYGGIKLGQPYQPELANSSFSEQQMIPYLNEMATEPIEAFLME